MPFGELRLGTCGKECEHGGLGGLAVQLVHVCLEASVTHDVAVTCVVVRLLLVAGVDDTLCLEEGKVGVRPLL